MELKTFKQIINLAEKQLIGKAEVGYYLGVCGAITRAEAIVYGKNRPDNKGGPAWYVTSYFDMLMSPKKWQRHAYEVHRSWLARAFWIGPTDKAHVMTRLIFLRLFEASVIANKTYLEI